ncbi:hypothetical protein EDD37DRAFT_628870 [Exophiala viscosa]|uniref:uncharacterized protein n=1 Tax=Exophiala viscosa TaxID=2486360 RepID=UPI00218D4190|nr:hypothetical protein EDD37DRAFT_628870 [Exophiala viscosa]
MDAGHCPHPLFVIMITLGGIMNVCDGQLLDYGPELPTLPNSCSDILSISRPCFMLYDTTVWSARVEDCSWLCSECLSILTGASIHLKGTFERQRMATCIAREGVFIVTNNGWPLCLHTPHIDHSVTMKRRRAMT